MIAELASKRGLRVEYGTHYDAFNWEIRWWEDDVLHTLDIQPYPEARIEVYRRYTHYPLLSRLLAWAREVIPMFPDLGRSTREPVATLAWPSESDRLRDVIESELALADNFLSAGSTHPTNQFVDNVRTGGPRPTLQDDEVIMAPLPALPELTPGLYRHYKGNDYEVVAVARHSETREPVVVYRALYGEGGLWVRPYAMFCEDVVVDGHKVRRFVPVESA